MADFFFFTDPAVLSGQQAGQAFGPLPADPQGSFRVCALHEAGAQAPAFAVCDGLVATQEVNATTVNLILRPTLQPGHELPEVRYFVYRGINRAALMTSNGEIPPAGNELVAHIHHNHARFNADRQDALGSAPNDSPSAELLGPARTRNCRASDPIDCLFFMTGSDYQLPSVTAGMYLGDFVAASFFGFQVVLDEPWMPTRLQDVRSVDHVIGVPALPAAATPTDRLRDMRAREAILNYLDPCAFYGAFYGSRLKVRSIPGAGNPVLEMTGNAIYDQLLVRYAHPDRIYLDIRNEHHRTYNAYGNYDGSIQLILGGGAAQYDYYQDRWPLFIITSQDYAGANIAEPRLPLRLAFPKSGQAGDNEEPVAFLSRAYSPSSFPAEVRDHKKFAILGFQQGIDYTTVLDLTVPNYNAARSVDTPICQFLRVKYCKGFDWCRQPRPSSGTLLQSAH